MPTRRMATWLRWLLVLASVACASVRPGSALSSPTSAASTEDHGARRARDVITRDEIVPAVLSAYDVVQQRRPFWITPREFSLTGKPVVPDVYVDGIRFGSCETLKRINTTTVAELRFLDILSATTLYGPAGANGIILVTLRRR